MVSESTHLSGHVNMVDVARRAGVSIATVSRALRGMREVNAETRGRVLQAAADLGYVVSPEASGLARRSTRRVAVVVPTLDIWFYSVMLAGLEDVLREAEFDVMVYQVDGEAQRARFVEQLPARRKVDAVVLVALPLRPEEELRLDLLGVQVVVAGGRIRDHASVQVDDAAMTRVAIEHLIGLGHRRIAMLRTNDTDGTVWSADQVRTGAWRELTAQGGCPAPDELLVSTPAGPSAGAEGMARLWALPQRPTAVLAYSDEIAISALGFLASQSVSVPDEISVMGIDGHPMGASFGLTTVVQSVRQQGRMAAALAIDLVNGRDDVPRHQRVAHHLEPGRTTGPPPTARR